jgi:hypothetical protein
MESNSWCPRLTAAMILLGSLVQVKGIGVGIGDEVVDCILEVLEGTEDATLEAPLGQEREQTFDRVEPGGRSRGEVEDKTRVVREPFQHLGMLVRGVVVDNGVDGEFGRRPGIDNVEEADELLMAMAFHALADDLAFEDVESGEQGRGAVPFVVVGHCAGAPLLHRQARLGAVERLDLALLIDRQDDGVVRRIDIEPDDVAQFGDELRVIGQLELTHPMRLQAMRPPDALHRADADPDRLGHGRAGPMGGVRGRSSQGQGHHALGNLGVQGRNSRRPRLVTPESGGAFGAKPFLPTPDHGLGLAGLPHDLSGAVPIGGQQQRLKGARGFNACKLMAKAEMRPGPERDVPVRSALQVEPFGMLVCLRVHIGGRGDPPKRDARRTFSARRLFAAINAEEARAPRRRFTRDGAREKSSLSKYATPWMITGRRKGPAPGVGRGLGFGGINDVGAFISAQCGHSRAVFDFAGDCCTLATRSQRRGS